jgi:hypothetical protein
MPKQSSHTTPYEYHLMKRVARELEHIRRFINDVVDDATTLQEASTAEDLIMMDAEVSRILDDWKGAHEIP